MPEMCYLVTDSVWTVQRIIFRAQGRERKKLCCFYKIEYIPSLFTFTSKDDMESSKCFLFYVRHFTSTNLNTKNYSAVLYYEAGTVRPKYQHSLTATLVDK